jgi:nitrogen regulatory protein P-II 1
VKEIKAIIQPQMLADVVDALRSIPGLPGVTISEVRGIGRVSDSKRREDSGRNIFRDAAKAKLEIVVPDELVSRIVSIIELRARTGRPGDGKIFVYSVDEVVRIRTGERGLEAI